MVSVLKVLFKRLEKGVVWIYVVLIKVEKEDIASHKQTQSIVFIQMPCTAVSDYIALSENDYVTYIIT
jgi:hypothetical protein